MALVALVTMVIQATGCYSYVVVNSGAPLPSTGAEVRAHLTEPGRFRLTNITAENVVRVDGEVVRWGPDQLVLSAFWLRSRGGLEHKGVGETVVIPRTRIATLERKQVSAVRSGGFIGVTILLAALVTAAFGGGGGPGEGPNGGIPPMQ